MENIRSFKYPGEIHGFAEGDYVVIMHGFSVEDIIILSKQTGHIVKKEPVGYGNVPTYTVSFHYKNKGMKESKEVHFKGVPQSVLFTIGSF